MGLRARNFFRLGRAVDAVAGQAQADPGRADRIARPRRQHHFMRDALGLGGVGEERRIERVVGIGIDHLDREDAVRPLVLVLRDGAGEEGDDFAAGVERLDAGFREDESAARRPCGIGAAG